MTHPHRDREGGIMTEIADNDRLTGLDRLRMHLVDPDTFPVCFDDIEDVVSEIDRALQDERDGGWQDMSSAPRDGTNVDLWCINHHRHDKKGQRVVNVAWGPVRDWMGNERDDWQHGHGEDFQPVAWRPLPRPPHSKDSEG